MSRRNENPQMTQGLAYAKCHIKSSRLMWMLNLTPETIRDWPIDKWQARYQSSSIKLGNVGTFLDSISGGCQFHLFR